MTESIYPGLDVEREFRATHTQGLGETLLINEGGDVVGFAVFVFLIQRSLVESAFQCRLRRPYERFTPEKRPQ